MTALKAVTASSGARRHMVTVAALAAGAALVLSGCSAGQISQTATQVAAVNGNHADIDRVSLRNVHIVYPAAGSEYTNAKGGKAIIALSIVNNGETLPDEELTSITTDLGAVKLTGPGGDSAFKIAPQQTVVAGTTPLASAAKPDEHGASASSTATPTSTEAHATPAADQPSADPEKKPGLIEITGLTKDITPGLTYPVTFNFKKNGTVTVLVPVDAGGATERHEDGKAAAEGGHSGGH